MTEWPKVRWAQARQVTRLMGVKDSAGPAEDVTPAAWCAALVDQGNVSDAVSFIGQALPRFEGIVWAADAIDRMDGGSKSNPAMIAVRKWIDDPDDAGRRAAWDAAQAEDDDSPARALASAVFFSGGSIAPEDQAAVQPAPEISGRLAAVAVIGAAYRTSDPKAKMREAVAAAEAVAKGEAG